MGNSSPLSYEGHFPALAHGIQGEGGHLYRGWIEWKRDRGKTAEVCGVEKSTGVEMFSRKMGRHNFVARDKGEGSSWIVAMWKRHK